MTAKSTLFAAIILAAPSGFGQAPPPTMSVIDSAGNTFSISSDGPVTPGAAQTQPGGGTCFFEPTNQIPCSDVHIFKTDSSGNVIFGTLLGGPGNEIATGIAVDSSGTVYLTGTTSGKIPTTPNAANTSPGLAFAAKLSADGHQFLYVTYLPNANISSSGIAVDAQGNTYVTGSTEQQHAFVTKINADGSAFVYNTVFGGSKGDQPSSISVDAAGYAAVSGLTNSPDFPVSTGAFQSTLTGTHNVFVAKLNPAGAVTAATLLGGSGTDTPYVVRIDSAGNIDLGGSTTSFDFPTTPGSLEPVPLVPLYNLSPGAFAAQLTPDLSSLGYSTYVMLFGLNGVKKLVLGPSGDVYITGVAGAGFPVTGSASAPCIGGPTDTIVAHLDAHGALLDATYTGKVNVTGLGMGQDGFLFTAAVVSNPVPAVARLAFRDPPGPCLSSTVLNGATYFDSNGVAPGEFISLSGFGIGPENGVASQPDAQGRPPITLSGVQVLFDGQAAPLLYVQSRQINAVAPFEISGRKSTNITVQFSSRVFGPVATPVTGVSPAIFRRQAGLSALAVATNQDGSINGLSNPAARGSVVSLWGTGLGQTPGCSTGELNFFGALSLDTTVTIVGSAGLVPALYAGSAPGYLCGIEQINVQIPALSPTGALLIEPQATMNGTSSTGQIQTLIYVD